MRSHVLKDLLDKLDPELLILLYKGNAWLRPTLTLVVLKAESGLVVYYRIDPSHAGVPVV